MGFYISLINIKFLLYLFYYLLYRDLNPSITGSEHINAKKRVKKKRMKKRKGIEAQRVKPPTPSRETDALIGDEEQNRKQKRTERKKQGSGP